MSLTRALEARPYDHVYGPVYADARGGPSTITGSLRPRYFARPPAVPLNAMPASVRLAAEGAESDGDDAEADAARQTSTEPFAKDAAVQTKFRDGEAQTDPYTPAHVVDANRPDPELLVLARLGHEDGIGAQVAARELDRIDWAREKRRIEDSMPPFTDEASLALRTRLMEMQELEEFRLREADMERENRLKVDALRRRIEERDAAAALAAEQRIDALRQRQVEERDRRLAKIQTQRVKVVRKLAKARAKAARAVPGAPTGRDIIGDYADFGSAVYAPVVREGRNTEKASRARLDVASKTAPLRTVAGIEELAASVPLRMLSTRVVKPGKEEGAARGGEGRHAASLHADLERMDRMLQTRRHEETAAAAAAPESRGPRTPVTVTTTLSRTPQLAPVAAAERPPTPTFADAAEDAAARAQREAREAERLAVLLLQRLLRGRAVQNTMYEGTERRRELIRELQRAAAARAEEESGAQPSEKEREEAAVCAARDIAGGEILSSLLSLLARKKQAQGAAAAEEDDEQRRQQQEQEQERQQQQMQQQMQQQEQEQERQQQQQQQQQDVQPFDDQRQQHDGQRGDHPLDDDDNQADGNQQQAAEQPQAPRQEEDDA